MRHIVVLKEDWIFVGDVREMAADGMVRLDRAVHVIRTATGGLAGLAKQAQGADVRAVEAVEYHKSAELFRIPVSDTWGL